MARRWQLYVVSLPLLLFGADQSWQNKPIPEWNDNDTHQILSDSPWAKVVTPKLTGHQNGGTEQDGGIGPGHAGERGFGGMRGLHRRSSNGSTNDSNANVNLPKTLIVRWESAMPVQAAELKAHNVDAPMVNEKYYGIAVYGIPSAMISSDSGAIQNELKEQSAIKRDGKKDIKPSRVEILLRDESAVVLYLFPRSKEITGQDKQIGFSAQIGGLQVSASFNSGDMMYQGKLQL